MKIIVVNGSPRKNGATASINQAFCKSLLALDDQLEIETIELGKIRPQYCDGCLYCYRTGECHIKDDGMDEISRRIALCDGLVLASPTYGSTVSGLCKTFIDRGHLLVEQALYNKPCVIITTYANAQGRQAVSFMNQTVMTAGGYSIGRIVAKVPFNGNPLTVQIQKQLDLTAMKLYHAIQAKGSKKPIAARIFHFVAFHFVLKRYALKHTKEYHGVLAHWAERGLIQKEALS